MKKILSKFNLKNIDKTQFKVNKFINLGAFGQSKLMVNKFQEKTKINLDRNIFVVLWSLIKWTYRLLVKYFDSIARTLFYIFILLFSSFIYFSTYDYYRLDKLTIYQIFLCITLPFIFYYLIKRFVNKKFYKQILKNIEIIFAILISIYIANNVYTQAKYKQHYIIKEKYQEVIVRDLMTLEELEENLMGYADDISINDFTYDNDVMICHQVKNICFYYDKKSINLGFNPPKKENPNFN